MSGGIRSRAGLLNLAGIVIGVAGIAFVVVRIYRDREAIGDAFESATLSWLAAGLVSGWVAMALIGLAWLWIMSTSDVRPDRRRGMSWFFVGQLGKYVPGGIWPIVGQAELAHRGTVPRRAAYTSTAWSMIGTFVGAGAVAAVTGLTLHGAAPWVAALIGVGLVIMMIAVTLPASRRTVARLLQRVTRRTLGIPEAGWCGQLLLRHVPVWVCFAGMNVFAVVALGVDLEPRTVVQLIAATCLSWMAGFVIIGLPGGLGVRETVFIALMTAPLGETVAISTAVVSRVVSVVVDLSAAGIATLIARRAPRPTPLVETLNPATNTATTTATSTATPVGDGDRG